MSAVDELIELLKSIPDLRVTFDSGRNFTHPCTFCGRSDEPRKLVDLGTYYDGETLTRPVCERCTPIVEARKQKAARKGETT